jgi:hypothetical protein
VAYDPNPPPSFEELEDSATNEMVDEVLDQIIGTDGGIIIHRYLPTRSWLWQQWYATVLYHSAWNAIGNMLGATIVCAILRKVTHGDWNIWALPDRDRMTRLLIFEKIWRNLMSLTTFLLTFFVGQAFSFWRSVYELGRSIQGRMNDIHLLLATHAARKRDGTYTAEAEAFLKDISSKLRAFHILMWAGQARRFRMVLTDRGFSRMIARGMLTVKEKETLDLQLGVPRNQKHIILLEWVLFKCREARNRNIIQGDSGLEHMLLEKVCALRSSCSQVSHKVNGRMPLAYAHFVQILVDSFLFFAPFAQYADLGIFAVLSVGILTLFYSGLLDLAKVFLDPLDNDDYREGCVYMDLAVFLRESNAASNRMTNAASKMTW